MATLFIKRSVFSVALSLLVTGECAGLPFWAPTAAEAAQAKATSASGSATAAPLALDSIHQALPMNEKLPTHEKLIEATGTGSHASIASGVAKSDKATAVAPVKVDTKSDAASAISGVNKSLADAVQLEAKIQSNVLEGHVESGDRTSPFLEGSIQTIPKGTKMELTLTNYINSELSQKGDEVFMKVSANVPGGKGVAVPGGWFAHGFVTKAQKTQMAHRNGYVEIEFDKLVSPDGHAEVDFPAKLSTKDSAMTSTLKEVAFGSKCTTVSAIGGAIVSVQLTGLGGAVATHGISVGVGAGIGAALGIIGALKREGNAESLYSGDDLKLTITEPIMLPAFKQELLPSAKKVPVLKDMKISVNKIKFLKDPSGDNQSRLMDVDITVDNHTKKAYSPRQLMVIDDRGHEFTPWLGENVKALMQKIGPEQSGRIDVLYEVNSGKRKYWLSLRETSTGAELSRVPITIE